MCYFRILLYSTSIVRYVGPAIDLRVLWVGEGGLASPESFRYLCLEGLICGLKYRIEHEQGLVD